MNSHNLTDQMVVLIDLPESLVNNSATAQVWYNKYVPEGYRISEVRAFEPGAEVEAEEQESEYVGFGDELDYVGSEEDPDGFSIVEVDTEEDEEDEED
jgi:hypothetical protein